jgi:hypothetical protein
LQSYNGRNETTVKANKPMMNGRGDKDEEARSDNSSQEYILQGRNETSLGKIVKTTETTVETR